MTHPKILAIAVMLAATSFVTVGCGRDSSDSSDSGATASTTPNAETTRFLALGNDVCTTVQHDAPAPLSRSARVAELRRYAQAASAPARRTAVSLRRIDPPSELSDQFQSLVSAWRSLQATYTAATQDGTRGKRFTARSLSRLEQETSSRAIALGLPACAPVGAQARNAT